MMLDAFYERVGQERMAVAKERGLTFHQILVLASIVEREAVVDEERPLIAGVYQNRLNPKKFPTGLLQSDPTIFYVNDTLKLARDAARGLGQVRVLGRPEGREAAREAARRPRRVQHLHEQGPPARARSPRPRSRRSMRRSTRTPSPATCSSSRRATARAPARSRRPRPRTTRTSRSTARRTDVALPRPGATSRRPPDAATRARWREAERSQLPGRLERLRARMAAEGVDAYFGVKREHMRWLTGFTLADGEEKVAGHSGQLLVGPRGRRARHGLPVHDPGAPRGAGRRGRRDRLRPRGRLAAARWSGRGPGASPSRPRPCPHALWERLAAAAPDVELVAADGWIEAMRAVKTPDEIERIAAACAVADRALAALLPEIRAGRDRARPGPAPRVADADRRRGGAGVRRRLPRPARRRRCRTGRPATGPSARGEVLLFDFGAQVEGYRSDMTRTLFVGEPAAARPRRLRPRAAGPAGADRRAARRGSRTAPLPGRSRAGRDRPRRDRRGRDLAGVRPRPGPRDRPRHPRGAAPVADRARDPLPSPTVFSVEPGIYLEGETGVRIEDLVHLDASRGVVERLTRFPRDVIVLAG